MREIKFRAWDLEFKKMWLPHDSCFECLKHENQQASITGFMMSDTCHLMQYTGLKDKNGIEIYEEDVLSKTHEIQTFIREVIWNKKYAFFGLADDLGLVHNIDAYINEYAVIGNIYENPELFKNKAE
jgi:uncharacterized phage protein (TIGR01671 family)